MPSTASLHSLRALACRERSVTVGGAPLIMGILNVTPDSFFDGGRFIVSETALQQAGRMVQDGAALLDVGGQSTRPGHEEVSVIEEIDRVVPVIEALGPRVSVPISIDTYKPAVARAAFAAGAHVLNDVHGLQRNPEIADLAAKYGCAVIVMHQDAAFRDAPGDVIHNMSGFFERSLGIAARAGVARDRIVLDPGIGFGKTPEQNLEILGRLAELHAFGCPLLLGASRKSVISHVLRLPPEERLEGTLAISALAVWQRVHILRVHDVRENLRAARLAHAIRQTAPS